MIIVQAGNLSLSLFASFNVLAEHTSELFLNVAAENMLNTKCEVIVPGSFNPSTYLWLRRMSDGVASGEYLMTA